jgi:hypothetical protein
VASTPTGVRNFQWLNLNFDMRPGALLTLCNVLVPEQGETILHLPYQPP